MDNKMLWVKTISFFALVNCVLEFFSSIDYNLQKFTVSLIFTFIYYKQLKTDIFIEDIYAKIDVIGSEQIKSSLRELAGIKNN